MSSLETVFDLNFEAYLQGPALLAAMAGMGLVVGVLTGLFGVGGGFLITPLLNVAFGVPYQLAIGSGLSFTIGTSASGMRRHSRLGNFEPRSMVILAATSMLGAVLGATLNGSLHVALGERNYTLMLHCLFLVTLGITAWLVARGNINDGTRKSLLQRMPPPRIDLPRAGLAGVSLPGLCMVGLFIGVMKGMLGIGGGVLLMPVMILVVGLTPHQAVGTSLGVVLFSSIAGAAKYGADGHVNLCLVMSLLVSSVFGVQLGARICHSLHAERLKRYFAILVGLVAIAVAGRLGWQLLWDACGGPV